MRFRSRPCGTRCAALRLAGAGHHQGICPVGWHIPKAAEWNLLATMLGGDSVAGQKMKLNTTGYSSWDASTYNDGNSSGFSALPAGYRYNGGGFNDRGYFALFREASENGASDASLRSFYFGYAGLYVYYGYRKTYGFSVRCIKDQ